MSIDLTPVRDLITLDGGDVELVGEEEGVAHLRLVLEDASCADCVMPRAVLEDVAAKLLGRAVRIDDPRE